MSLRFGKILSLLAAAAVTVAGHILVLKDTARAEMTINEKLRQVAEREIAAHPEKFSDETKRNILDQRITLGMTPYEVRLAGGAFYYEVEADPKRWPRGSDPIKVIATQTDEPDDSKITLTFQNTTQFQTPEPVTFRVRIMRGKVTEIVRADR